MSLFRGVRGSQHESPVGAYPTNNRRENPVNTCNERPRSVLAFSFIFLRKVRNEDINGGQLMVNGTDIGVIKLLTPKTDQ